MAKTKDDSLEKLSSDNEDETSKIETSLSDIKKFQQEPIVENKKFLEICATLSGSLTKLTVGVMVAWSSPSLPQLFASDSPIKISSSDGAWIVSAFQMGSFVSFFLMAATVDLIGRKTAILSSTVPVLISWFLISQARSVQAFLIARFIGGIGGGYGIITYGTYIGEIADPRYRGILGTVMAIFYNLGIILVYVVAPFVSIQTFAWFAMVIPVTLLATFIWMPETPYYYLLKGNTDLARKTLIVLRGHENIDREYERINESVELRPKFWISFKSLFTMVENRRSFIVASLLFVSIQSTGKFPIISYMQTIFNETEGHISTYMSSIIICLIQILALVLTLFIIDCSGRRPLLIWSSLGCGISLATLSLFFYLKNVRQLPIDNIQWIPLTSLIVYNFLLNIGLNNIPFIMVGELFHTNVKATAVCLATLMLPISSIFMTKLYQLLVDSYGMYSAFLAFTVCSLITAVYCVMYVPETKGKSLEEIQECLKGKNRGIFYN